MSASMAPIPLAGSERPRPRTHRRVGPLDSATEVAVTIFVRPRPGSPPLPDLAHWQNTPPGKRQYLTPDEYAGLHGAAPADMDAVHAFAAVHGLTVLESHAGRRTVHVVGSAAQIDAAFGVTLHRYQAPVPSRPGRTPQGAHATPAAETYHHHGFDGPVHLPASLAGIVTAVVGLDDRRVSTPAGSTGDPPNSTALAVPTAAGLYNFPNSGAAGVTIGVHAPQTSAGNGASYLANDINNTYFPSLAAGYQTAPAAINNINLTIGTTTFSNSPATVQGITAATNLNSFPFSFIIELTQDISTSATIAQGATVNVYFTQDSEQGWAVFLNRVLLPPVGESQPDTITSSFPLALTDDSGAIGSLSSSSSTASVMTTLFQQLAAVGINVFIALGDWGSDDKQTDGKTHVSYPGSDPWITSCGGTVLGNIQAGPPQTFQEFSWSNVTSASQAGGVGGATGGGASATFPVPGYQTSAGLTQITNSAGNKLTNRFVPDIAAMVAFSGFVVNGLNYTFVGTSCVAPLFAGLAAVLRKAFGVSLGFLNPSLYALGTSATNDITTGNNDSADGTNAPFYTTSAGWDPCTGWGSLDGIKLLNGIAGLTYSQTFYFQINKNTFGLDEVAVNASYPTDFWLVLEGFTPAAASGHTPALSGTFVSLTVDGNPAITVTVGAAQPELAGQPNTPQRILYPCKIDFAAAAVHAVPQGIFPQPGGAATVLPLTALLSIQSQFLTAIAVFELVAGADPSFANFNAAANNVFYLSQDLRVFTVTPGIQNNPVAGVSLNPNDNTNFDTSAGYNYIQALINQLNNNFSSPTGTDPFTLLPDQSNALTGNSSVTPTSVNPANPGGTPFANYTFGIARVRLTGQANTTTPSNVRVFFRLFATVTSDTDYQPGFSYPSTNDAAGLPGAPLLGAGNVTIPFFAAGNYEANADFGINTDYSANSVNNQPISTGGSGSVWAYYGCYLNIYPTGNTIGGKAVQAMLPGTHNCLVAQIAFDGAPIPTSGGAIVGPENSDKLAQRNLQITLSDNPGPPSTHRIPQTFDTRPGITPPSGATGLQAYPDELMIDWGNTPAGSTASIYWPRVASSDVLALAKTFYSTQQLAAADANTVRCTVPHGYTFVPIPPGAGESYAGLFTVNLPPGVTSGEVFTIVVRRLATHRYQAPPPPPPPPQIQIAGTEAAKHEKITRDWRYVVGTFAVRIPVTTGPVMLPIEENTLSIMKWRLSQTPPSDRWYPVLLRYIGDIGGRVQGLGGNPITIEPSPIGIIPIPVHVHAAGREETGKVCGLIYDRFGDFEGFLLLTESGHEHRYRSRESEIEALVRFAWQDRVVTSVIATRHEPHCPVSIILRHAPPQPRRWPA